MEIFNRYTKRWGCFPYCPIVISPKIQKLLHSCLLIEESGKRILIDPGDYCFIEKKITPEQLKDYACQYYKHVEAFPRYLSAIHSNSTNAKAQKLYAAYGFEKAGEYQYPVGAWMDDEFILRRG